MTVSSPSTGTAKGQAHQADEESVELQRFRQEWLEELHKRKASSSEAPTADSAGSNGATPDHGRGTLKLPDSASHPVERNIKQIDGEACTIPPVLRKALDIYGRAIDQEQAGDFDAALLLYRQAFRLDDKVDRAYHRELKLNSIASKQPPEDKTLQAVEEISRNVVTVKTPNMPSVITGSLAVLIQSYPDDLKFEPENEHEPVFLNRLPEELLVFVISKLDPTSIERFARLSKKARVLTLDSGIWRELVVATYKPPQILDREETVPIIERYLFDYRRIYVEQPRVRLDGVYIAICHYVRPGLSENYWVNVSHLITYHRYLRFFPNGQVLSLLANEEKHPQEIIPLLKPSLRMKGLFVGHWKLIGTTVCLSNLVDASGRFPLPVFSILPSPVCTAFPVDGGRSLDLTSLGNRGAASSSAGAHFGHASTQVYGQGHGHGHGYGHTQRQPGSSLLSTQTDKARYVFDMTLNLRSKPLGRWNRMDIQSYDSVNLENGDVHPVALKHERPFWFSKVRSYT